MLHKSDYKAVRVVAASKGRIAAIKWVRTNVVNNYIVAKMVVEDILADKPWTFPHVMAR